MSDIENVKIIDRNEERATIENLINTINPFSIFVFGRSGTGKTLLVRNILMNKFNDFIYINFGQLKVVSTQAMYLNMISHIINKYLSKGYFSRFLKKEIKSFFDDIPSKGLSDNDYHTIFMEAVENAQKKDVVVIFDEINKLVEKKGDQILYAIFDIHGFRESGISTIAISNDMKIFSKMKEDIKQRVVPLSVNFSSYCEEDIYQMVVYYLNLIGEIGCNPIDISQTSTNISSFTKSARTVKLYLYYILNKYKRLNPDAVFESEIQSKVNTDSVLSEVKRMTIYEQLILQAVFIMFRQMKNNPDNPNISPTMESIYEIYKDLFKKEQKEINLDIKYTQQHIFYKFLQQNVKHGLLISKKVGFGRGKGVKSLIYPNMEYIELRMIVKDTSLSNEDMDEI